MKTLAIIQARVGSTRLPGKVLQLLAGKTVLEQVICRVKASRLVDQVVIATTVNPDDLAIVKLCADFGIGVYCGSENDVLDRYYQTAKSFGADQIVRITSDCPLLDPQIIDKVIGQHLKDKADYTSNVLHETFPDGEDVEAFSFPALKKAWQEARLTSEREHVTPYLRNHPELFKLVGLENNVDLSKKRWTLDNQEDLAFIKEVYNYLYVNNDVPFGMEAILALLHQKPELEKLNSHISRNEGMVKSIREDRLIKVTEEQKNG